MRLLAVAVFARLTPPLVGGFRVRSGPQGPRTTFYPCRWRLATDHPILYSPVGDVEARWERPHLTIGSSRNPAAQRAAHTNDAERVHLEGASLSGRLLRAPRPSPDTARARSRVCAR